VIDHAGVGLDALALLPPDPRPSQAFVALGKLFYSVVHAATFYSISRYFVEYGARRGRVTVGNMSAMKHADIIATKGAAQIAGRLGVPSINVRMWKRRNTIPRSAWAELIDIYPDITLDLLKRGAQPAGSESRAA
jgi:hypothetical protein